MYACMYYSLENVKTEQEVATRSLTFEGNHVGMYACMYDFINWSVSQRTRVLSPMLQSEELADRQCQRAEMLSHHAPHL